METTKLLGLYIDKHLTWDFHVNQISSKINSGIYALKRLSFLCNMSALKAVFHAHVQSHIAYGICVYGGTSHQNLNKILVLQKRALRAMLHLKDDESVKIHFSNLKIMTVFSLYILETIMHIKTNQDKFVAFRNIHSHNTRGKNNMVLPHHKLEMFKQKTSYAGITFLNYIPKEIIEINDLNKFRKSLKNYLTEHTIYSFDDFYSLSRGS